MNLLTIAFKSLRQRSLASILTSFSVALGVMLMVAVLVIYGIVSNIFSQQSIGYDLIIGPSKGSELQLVLSTVYRISPPAENLPYSYYKSFKARTGIEAAIPVALGDTTQEGNFPICGTTPEYFAHEFAPRRAFGVRGDFFRKPFQAVIGSQVAAQNGWDLGSQLQLVHGGGDGHVHDEKFEVVGVLQATGTPNDKTVFVHLAGFYSIAGHDKPLGEGIKREREFYNQPALSDEELAKEVSILDKKFGHHDHEHKPGTQHFHDIAEVQKEVTAILVKLDPKYPIMGPMIAGELKDGFQAQAVNPIMPMRQLMDNLLGNIRNILFVLTALIILVSCIGIFVSIYNSMSARTKEIAIMRALGAQRGTVFSIILCEAIILCLGGGLLGLLLGHGLVFAAAPIVEARSGLLIDPWKFEPLELTLFPALALLATLVGLLPGWTAYRTDVAEGLSS